jgi:hypothetical protein
MIMSRSALAFKKGGKVAPRPKKLPPGGSLPSSLPAGLASLGGPNPPMGPNPGAGPAGPMMKRGGSVKKCAVGGGIESKGKTDGATIKMKGAGMAAKGKTPTKEYAGGGSVGRGDGCVSKGKTKARIC